MAEPETELTHGIEEASHGGVPHAAPSAFGLEPYGWVALAMAVFIAILLWRRVPALITRGLDGKIAAIREQLDEAKTLRAEAEALRAEYAAKLSASEGEAQAMRDAAAAESQRILAKAEQDAAEHTQRRARMAEDKIAAAERTALADVRAKAAQAAASAAASLIAAKHGANEDRALVDRTIANLN